MNLNEFNKRIFTSIFLVGLLYLTLKYSYIFILICIILFVITWIEFSNILKNLY